MGQPSVNPILRYALARLGIFAAAAVLAWLVLPGLDPFLTLLVALLVSAVISWFALRGMRNDVAVRMAAQASRRAEERERLRAALSGDDQSHSS